MGQILHVEFLYACVQKTIEIDLPEEAHFLKCYDLFKSRVETAIEMPDSMIDLMFNFLRQNEGLLSKRAVKREFSDLTSDEVAFVEKIYADIFED